MVLVKDAVCVERKAISWRDKSSDQLIISHQRTWLGISWQLTKEIDMHAVVRTYSGAGAKQLFDVLEEHKADVEATLRKVPGLVSYTLLRQGEGGMSVTVCTDKAGADESLKVARDWIQKNASDVHAGPPSVTEGSVIVQIT